MCDESNLVKWCICTKFWINWSLIIKLTGSVGRISIMKSVIFWRYFSRLLTVVQTNNETKESPFFSQGSVCFSQGSVKKTDTSCSKILGDQHTVCCADVLLLTYLFWCQGLRNSHALYNPFKSMSTSLNKDHGMI